MRVCLVTTGQPSTNPRLVKEADTLIEAGHDVHVVGAHWTDWAAETDRQLLADRAWTASLVDWRRESAPALFHWSRLRSWAARRAAPMRPASTYLALSSLSRVGPELRRRVGAVGADLYVAHNIGAIPIAYDVGRSRRVPVGFDAEDFHSGQFPAGADDDGVRTTRETERRLLPRCSYVTAASPLIAEAYRDLCGIALPPVILNVFPLSDRPADAPRRRSSSRLTLYWFSQTIGPDRGLEDVVRGMGLLGNDVELHLRGRWHGRYEAELRQVAASSGVAQERIISHEPAPPGEMVRLAAAYDVGLALEPGITPNNDVALSNKIFTYLLAGNAIAATRTRAQAALAPDLGIAAAWSNAGDPMSLAAALLPWLEHRQTLDEARDVAWRLGTERFNWDVEKKKWLAVIERAVAATSPTARVACR